jgi:hypothetical protein
MCTLECTITNADITFLQLDHAQRQLLACEAWSMPKYQCKCTSRVTEDLACFLM